MLKRYSFKRADPRDYLISLSLNEVERNPNSSYNLAYVEILKLFYAKEKFKTLMQNLILKHKNTLIEEIFKKEF